jgi:hypothetical protein
MLSILSPLSSFGDIFTDDGINIQFFMKKVKKPISDNKLMEGSIVGIGDRVLDKIVFRGIRDWYGEVDLDIKIYKEERTDTLELIMSKHIQSFSFTPKTSTYTLPIYPWIDDIGIYYIEIVDGGKKLIEFKYEIMYSDGEG